MKMAFKQSFVDQYWRAPLISSKESFLHLRPAANPYK
jgi:hypothetical protein